MRAIKGHGNWGYSSTGGTAPLGVQLHSCLTSAIDTAKWSASNHGCFTPRETVPCTPEWAVGWIQSWPECFGENTILSPVRNLTTIPWLSSCCPDTSLYYPGSVIKWINYVSKLIVKNYILLGTRMYNFRMTHKVPRKLLTWDLEV
jgi:hypothetical protein